MSKFFVLLKIRADEHLGISKMLHSGSRQQTFSLLTRHICLILLYAAVFAMLTALFRRFAVDYSSLIPVLAYLLSFVVCFIQTILKMNSLISGNDDSEFLLSTPLSEFSHILMIFLTLYVSNFLIVVLICCPAFLAVRAEIFPTAAAIGRWIIGLLFTCLPAGGISALVGMVISLLLCTSPRKNQIESIFAILCTAGGAALLLIVINHIFSLSSAADAANAESSVSFLCSNFLFARMYQNAVVVGTTAYLVLFILLSSLWYIAFIFIIGISYRIIVISLRCPPEFPPFELSIQKIRPAGSALLHREISRVVLSREIFAKSMTGPIVGTLLAVNLCLIGQEKLSALASFYLSGKSMKWILPALLCAFAASGTNGYRAYSSDGRTAWITASAPAETKRIFFYKVFSAVLISVPFSIIAGILCTAATAAGPMLALLYVLVSVLYSMACAAVGVLLDRRYADTTSAEDSGSVALGLPYTAGYLLWVVLPFVLILLI